MQSIDRFACLRSILATMWNRPRLDKLIQTMIKHLFNISLSAAHFLKHSSEKWQKRSYKNAWLHWIYCVIRCDKTQVRLSTPIASPFSSIKFMYIFRWGIISMVYWFWSFKYKRLDLLLMLYDVVSLFVQHVICENPK